MVWSSSQWISASSCSLSIVSSSRRQRTTCGCHSDSDRSGWTHDISCTTRHLCTSLHMGTFAHRCPGLECWTSSRHGVSMNHLQTTDSSLVYSDRHIKVPRLRFDVFIHWLCARYKLFLRLRLRFMMSVSGLYLSYNTVHIYVQNNLCKACLMFISVNLSLSIYTSSGSSRQRIERTWLSLRLE